MQLTSQNQSPPAQVMRLCAEMLLAAKAQRAHGFCGMLEQNERSHNHGSRHAFREGCCDEAASLRSH